MPRNASNRSTGRLRTQKPSYTLVLLLVLSVTIQVKTSSATRPSGNHKTNIIFGSCNKHQKMNETNIFRTIYERRPSVFVWLGDAVYADARVTFEKRKYFGSEFHRAAYDAVKSSRWYRKMVDGATTMVVGTWDDHDYGMNNAGKYWEHKESAKELFLDFLDEPKDSERRVNRDGVYESYVIEGGKGGEESVHIILLDTRWNFEDGSTNGIEADILGDRQWAWFENELMNSNSTITLIGSSIQVLSELNQMYKPIKYKIAREFGKSIENWGAFPSNQKRLLDIVAKSSKRTRAIFLSGDVHVGMIDSRLPGCWMPYETIDATSSGFTHVAVEEVRPKWVTFFYKLMTPSKFMPSWWYPKNVVPPIYMGLNFGEIEIDWTERKLDINILDEDGNIVIKKEVAFTSLEEAKAGNENEKPPTRDECFRERAMTDLQKQLTFHKAALFILFPWILVLVFALFLWYKFVVRLIFCTTLGRSRKKSKRA